MALGANAIFSITCAILMIFFPNLVGAWLGVQVPLLLQAIGIGLVLFGADLIHQTTRKRLATWRALYASAADILWVAGSIVLLAFFSQVFSPGGLVLVAAIALVVLAFGIWQLWGVGQAHRSPDSGLYRHCIAVSTSAPAEVMWGVIGRMGDIHKYMPSLRSSLVRDGKEPGVGAVRVCEDRAGKRWAEECIAFTEGRSFDVRFLADAPDFPFPASTMLGGWKVLPTGEDTSNVVVWWEMMPRPRLLSWIILPMLAFQVDRSFPGIVHRMAVHATADETDPDVQQPSQVLAQLNPSLC